MTGLFFLLGQIAGMLIGHAFFGLPGMFIGGLFGGFFGLMAGAGLIELATNLKQEAAYAKRDFLTVCRFLSRLVRHS